jgi:tRNA A-37 threonylcarbamoyl transferase component Bud32
MRRLRGAGPPPAPGHSEGEDEPARGSSHRLLRTRGSPPGALDDHVRLRRLVEAAEHGQWPADADPVAILDAALAREKPEAALALARRLVARRPEDDELRLAVAERLSARLDFGGARALLEPLLFHPLHGQRARFLTAEGWEQAGDLEAARRLYEQILAEDIDYPNARARAERLARRAVGPSASPALVPTMMAVEGAGTRASRYRLLRELGRGSAATVYLARDEHLEREVALKILHPQFYGAAQAAARARFFGEARIAASLRHRAIVAVYDVDEDLRLIAMEHCTGAALRDRLRHGPLDPATALARAADLFAVLEIVHRHGIVHRDLKPGNLLYRDATADATLVVADFGTAHLAAGAAGAQGAGTLLYMSPEQRRGAAPAPRDDLWAAGAVLYEMLTGAPPLGVEAALRGDPVDPRLLPALAAQLPALVRTLVEALLGGCLATQPAARLADARAARELAAAAALALGCDAAVLAAWEQSLERAGAARP